MDEIRKKEEKEKERERESKRAQWNLKADLKILTI